MGRERRGFLVTESCEYLLVVVGEEGCGEEGVDKSPAVDNLGA
jgi:hypothetical protein